MHQENKALSKKIKTRCDAIDFVHDKRYHVNVASFSHDKPTQKKLSHERNMQVVQRQNESIYEKEQQARRLKADAAKSVIALQ